MKKINFVKVFQVSRGGVTHCNSECGVAERAASHKFEERLNPSQVNVSVDESTSDIMGPRPS